MLSWMALLPGQKPPPPANPPDTDAPQPHQVDVLDAQALGWWALQFTPRVALLDEAVVLEIQASHRLFGGAQALRQRITLGALQWGCLEAACAPTAQAALALMRHGHRAGPISSTHSEPLNGMTLALTTWLDRLPLLTLRPVAKHQATLSKLGCQTLGDVRRLPRGGLSRRFGPDLLHALDQAYGQQPEAFNWCTLPERFELHLELPGRVDTTTALVFAARNLLQPLCAWLAGRQSGVRAFTLRWQHDFHRRDTARQGELTVRLSEVSRDLDRLHRLLAEHLHRATLNAPVGDLSLHVDDIERLSMDSTCLFQELGTNHLSAGPNALASPAAQRQQHQALSTLLERLSARLGPERVQQAVIQADHRAEHTQHWAPLITTNNTPLPARRPDPIDTYPQPCWRLAQPLPLALSHGDDFQRQRPVYQGPLRLLVGPHRVEAGWWDDHAVARDYYIAHSEHAGLVWVFRERHVPDNQRSPWFLHGLFA